MARRKNRNRTVERDHTTRSLAPLYRRHKIYVARQRAPILTLIDRRQFDPTRRSARPRAARRAHATIKADQFNFAKTRFAVPHKVAICVRRNIRKEVLHALNKTGKGSRARKRRNFWSEVKC